MDTVRDRFLRLADRMHPWYAALRRRSPALARAAGVLLRTGLMGYARLELPRCVGLVEAGLRAFPEAWPRSGLRECRGCWHGYRLRLDLADYFQRWGYYLRRYHDAPLQLLLGRALRPGDTLIDGGANAGLVSLYGAWRVGPTGRVHAIEPSPRMLEQLRWHVSANRLEHVLVHALALGDAEGRALLREPDPDNSGAGTLAPVPGRYGDAAVRSWEVRVAAADSLPELDVRGSLAVKLDIEGFEPRALRGMARLIERHRPLVVSEVNEEMLAQAGSSGRDLVGFLTGIGYRVYSYRTRRALVRHRRVELRELDPRAGEYPLDVAFVHPDSVFMDRLRRLTVYAGRGLAAGSAASTEAAARSQSAEGAA